MKKKVLIMIAIVLYLLFIPDYFHFDIKVKALVTLLIIQILWIGRVFPLAQSSILLILILSFHFFSYTETLSYFGSDIVWLLFSTFIISHAFIKTGLASRVSLKMLKLSKGSGKALILISYFLMFVLSIMIPSNVGKGSLVSSVFDSLLKSVEQIKSVKNLSKSLFIGITYLTSISGAFVATGASSTIYAFGLIGDFSADLNYLHWIYYFAPPIILFAIILWVLFLYILPPENLDKYLLINLIEKKIQALGKISLAEKKIIFIICLTLLLWSTQQWHHLSIPLIGLLGATLTFMPLIGVWKWEEAKTSIDWDMMLFFASTIMVSGMLIKTGTVDMVATKLVSSIPTGPPFLVLLILICFTAIFRIMFVNILGFLTIVLPLAITIGQSVPDLSPLIVTMAVFLAGIPGFLLITQSPVHLITFSYRYYTEKDLLKVGGLSLLVWILIILLTATTYWIFI